MRLLLVARRFPPDVRSGTETVFEQLYARARRRHEVRLVVGYRRGRDLVPPEATAVDLMGCSPLEGWARILAAALKEEKRFRPDVVLGNSVEVHAARSPLVLIIHDLNFGTAQRTWKSRARELFYRKRCGRADAVVAVSEAARVSLERRGIRPDWVEVIHNGVDLELFRSADSVEPPKETDSTVHFSCPSRILPGKGQHLALDALARLRRDYKTRAHLTIVGAVDDPIFRDQLLIQSYEQPARILGEVPDLASYYQQADVVVFPSLMEEGFGYTAIEAMACGKPVIWFDQPAVREACGGIGMPVAMGDVDGLRQAMMALMDDSDLRARLGEEGRAFVETHYRWDEVWARYESLLSQVAQKSRSAAE